MRQLKIEWIWNVPYSPDFQPIETVFSWVKRRFKQDKLRCLAAEEPFDQKAAIQQSFDAVPPEFIDKYIMNCLKLIERCETTTSSFNVMN